MRIRNESLAGGEDKKTNPISSLFHEASFLPSPVRPFVRSEDHGSLTDGSQTGYNGVKFIRLHIGAIKRQAGGARSRGRGTKEGLILNIIYLAGLKSEGGKRAPSPGKLWRTDKLRQEEGILFRGFPFLADKKISLLFPLLSSILNYSARINFSLTSWKFYYRYY